MSDMKVTFPYLFGNTEESHEQLEESCPLEYNIM
jgi:hypothetical protein